MSFLVAARHGKSVMYSFRLALPDAARMVPALVPLSATYPRAIFSRLA